MFTRIKKKIVSVYTKEPYYDKFIVFNKSKFRFKTFKDYIEYYKIPHSIFKNVKLPENIWHYILKLLSFISSCESLYIKEYDNNTKSVDMNNYSEKIQKVLDNFRNTYYLEEEYITIFEMEPSDINQYMGKYYYEKYPAKIIFEKIKKGDFVLLEMIMPKDIYDNYENYIVGVLENKTGDFYTDLFFCLIDQMAQLKLSRTCNNYNCPLITKQSVYEAIAVAVNYAIQALNYIKNCTSFRTDSLEMFDEIEIESRLSAISAYLKMIENLHT